MLEVPVLIVGGGPVGLSASFLLSQHGVRSLLVERHPSTALHPKARGINARTMEIFRQCGVEQAVRAAGLPPERTRFGIIWAHSLAGEEIERRDRRGRDAAHATVSPERSCACPQDVLEPVLRSFAEQQGPGELRFSTALTTFAQDQDGITATLVERTTGAETRVRAQYLIAADGAQSSVRRRLGIPMVGQAAVYESVNLLFRADLTPWTAHRPAGLYIIRHPQLHGVFLTINGVDRWGLLVNPLAPYGLTQVDFTPERSVELIRLAVGVPDLPVEILGIAPWTADAHVAERYAAGRIFLAGDAAHAMPPAGGFGMNTGIQDVHNLAWKLAAVLHGWASPALLATYDAERRPIGMVNTEQALASTISVGLLSRAPQTTTARPEFGNEVGLEFGAAYDSAAVIPDSTPPAPVANPVTDYIPSARPGGRAPHVWLERAGVQVSTLDLVGRHVVLLAGARGHVWREAAAVATAGSGPPLDVHLIGDGDLTDPSRMWAATYGIASDGAVLVRPDGHVAWRIPSVPADPAGTLAGVVSQILAT